MTRIKYKNTGVRILESEDGDILLCDTSLKIDTVMLKEALLLGMNDKEISSNIGKMLIKFIEKQRNRRRKIAERKLDLLERFDKYFTDKLRIYLTNDSLRKVEKDIHFYLNDNPEVGDVIEKDI